MKITSFLKTSTNKFVVLHEPVTRLRRFTTSVPEAHSLLACNNNKQYIDCRFPKEVAASRQNVFDRYFTVVPDAVTENEEVQLIDEIEKSLKRLRYQHDHWDDAIHGYRETEVVVWKNQTNGDIIQRLRSLAFKDDSNTVPMQRVHVLDICDDGYVKAHVDSIKFCGNIIAGLSLLSDSIMRLADEAEPHIHVRALLPRRSLYIMKNFDFIEMM
ncbi:alpha-ketoglutarate-dependent dioxygenase alkB homolog 7, mitochondrial isoform X2 [Adelges cooleyi]|uniref:alpha-ketoglutarate-dependent dioxygenase alkB homolog 7, mitochondrial isoform X2 n=1 Tax=Adelges cooleyi TaxID=133065 RepID=UPI00217FA263|nr:alpha-ketoglutarate-dependent dioxygenase alkB homolog 7, mitochondrial isoform X2 [Adelges cooleyi]